MKGLPVNYAEYQKKIMNNVYKKLKKCIHPKSQRIIWETIRERLIIEEIILAKEIDYFN
jgi:nitrate/TMAO reductase-like tetraheme cytochrome c subunit